MYILIVGASSAIAQALIKEWIYRGEKNFIFIGRNLNNLSTFKKSLKRLKMNLNIRIYNLDEFTLEQIHKFQQCFRLKNKIKIALICFGYLPNQASTKNDLSLLENALIINGVMPLIWTEFILANFITRKKGTIIMLSSIAGDLGKKSNYIYGASKASLNIYYEGLVKEYADKNINFLLVKAGPVKTPMTLSYKYQFILQDAKKLAINILIAIEHKKNIIYFPNYWRFSIFILRLLPRNFLNLFKI
jgi:short-subunit dehydrogenase